MKSTEEQGEQEEPPKPPEGWDRCHAYLKQKKRFCRQIPPPGTSKYCGNHHDLLSQEEKANKARRIPCPLDPSHSIREDQIERHLLVCPKTKLRKFQESQSFYKLNINATGYGRIVEPVEPGEAITFEEAQALALSVLVVYQTLFCNSQREPASLSEGEIHNSIPLLDFSKGEIDRGLEETEEEHRIITGGTRHIHQRASMIGNLRRVGILPPLSVEEKSSHGHSKSSGNDCSSMLSRTILEVGAGKGITGLVLSGVSAASGVSTKLLVVDRDGTRGKAEKIQRKARILPTQSSPASYPFDLASVDVERVRCDIAHVDVSCVLKEEIKQEREIDVISKHLCGVGTDLALKSLEPVKEHLHSCFLLTCCHGLCKWEGYVGRDWLRSAMMQGDRKRFGKREFDLLCKWSAGACLSSEQGEQEVDTEHSCQVDSGAVPKKFGITKIVQSLGLSCGTVGLGRCCQRLIDYGRREYLQKVLFACESETALAITELFYYVPHSVTPQNAALLAYRVKESNKI